MLRPGPSTRRSPTRSWSRSRTWTATSSRRNRDLGRGQRGRHPERRDRDHRIGRHRAGDLDPRANRRHQHGNRDRHRAHPRDLHGDRPVAMRTIALVIVLAGAAVPLRGPGSPAPDRRHWKLDPAEERPSQRAAGGSEEGRPTGPPGGCRGGGPGGAAPGGMPRADRDGPPAYGGYGAGESDPMAVMALMRPPSNSPSSRVTPPGPSSRTGRRGRS